MSEARVPAGGTSPSAAERIPSEAVPAGSAASPGPGWPPPLPGRSDPGVPVASALRPKRGDPQVTSAHSARAPSEVQPEEKELSGRRFGGLGPAPGMFVSAFRPTWTGGVPAAPCSFPPRGSRHPGWGGGYRRSSSLRKESLIPALGRTLPGQPCIRARGSLSLLCFV